MEIYHQLPEELQKIIKYFVLECPHTLPKRNVTYKLTNTYCIHHHFYREVLDIFSSKGDNYISEDYNLIVNSLDDRMRIKFPCYFSVYFVKKTPKKEITDFIRTNFKLYIDINRLCRIEFDKQLSRMNKPDLFALLNAFLYYEQIN